MIFERALSKVVFDDLALWIEYPWDHLCVLALYPLLTKLLEAPILVDHALGLGDSDLVDMPQLEQTRSHWLAILGLGYFATVELILHEGLFT